MTAYNQAVQYFLTHKKISYEQALDYAKIASENNEPGAHYVYSLLLRYMHDEDKSLAPYVAIVEEGANKGCPKCGVLLGILTQQGRVTEKHPVKAKIVADQHFSQLENLAFEGDMFAQALLGSLYQSGIFVKKDIQTALRYYHQAQRQHLTVASHQLGQLYQKKSPYQDLKKSEQYMDEALKAGFISTLFIKGMQAMKEKQTEEAIYFLEQAANQKYHHAMFSLATFYISKKEHEKAFALFLRASELGHVKATYMVGLSYLTGRGVEKNNTFALAYLKHAADDNDMLASYQLATLLMKKPQKNYLEIYDYFMIAAKKKHPLALYNLGVMHLKGDGMSTDYQGALAYFEQGAILGLPLAQYEAAKLLYEGVHVTKNEGKALQYLQLAAKKKFKPAEQMLQTIQQKQSNKKTFTA